MLQVKDTPSGNLEEIGDGFVLGFVGDTCRHGEWGQCTYSGAVNE